MYKKIRNKKLDISVFEVEKNVPKSIVITVIVCAYVKAIRSEHLEKNPYRARIFQLQSSFASAESHMRERETDYILRIEYERPKVGGGISRCSNVYLHFLGDTQIRTIRILLSSQFKIYTIFAT